ncbi:TlpA family protein disulfide reductase, partial [Streptomyces nojiriensis]|uniref:TlpA family protein disulfide reductase n=1 Tax=Streptomyces nojiriensis TaxID=66374 RepID=UPI0035E07833
MRPVGPHRVRLRTAVLTGAALVAAVAGCVFAAVGTVAADGSRAEAAAGPVTAARAVVGTAAGATVIDPADRPAAPTLAGDDLDGKPVGLDGLRGNVVVLNVWGSWCCP